MKDDDEGFGFTATVIILALLLAMGAAAYIADLLDIVSITEMK